LFSKLVDKNNTASGKCWYFNLLRFPDSHIASVLCLHGSLSSSRTRVAVTFFWPLFGNCLVILMVLTLGIVFLVMIGS
jgi:hypothetical protein